MTSVVASLSQQARPAARLSVVARAGGKRPVAPKKPAKPVPKKAAKGTPKKDDSAGVDSASECAAAPAACANTARQSAALAACPPYHFVTPSLYLQPRWRVWRAWAAWWRQPSLLPTWPLQAARQRRQQPLPALSTPQRQRRQQQHQQGRPTA